MLNRSRICRNVAAMVIRVNIPYDRILSDSELSDVWDSIPKVEATHPFVAGIKWMASWNADLAP